MIYVYGDMSGTKLSKWYVTACYLGTEKQWNAVDAKWEAAPGVHHSRGPAAAWGGRVGVLHPPWHPRFGADPTLRRP